MLRGGGREKLSKTVFFAKSPSPRRFFGEKFFMDSTMRKRTDSAFRICGSHRGTYDQKYSYRSSKSGQVGKSGFVPENTGCHKKWMRAQFFVTCSVPEFFFPDFVLTLEADNYGLKAPIIKNYHIFGNLWTSAFTWYHTR